MQTPTPAPPAAAGAHAVPLRARGRRFGLSPTATVAVVLCLVAAAMPFYLSSFWLQTGLFCFAASIGAMGLNLLASILGGCSP